VSALDPRVAELLSALLDGAVDDDERATAEAWLERSPEARAEYESLAQVKAALGGLGEVEPPFGFYDRMLRQGTPEPEVVSAVDRAEARRSGRSLRSSFVVIGTLVASAAAFVVVGGVAGPDRQIRPPIEAVAAGDADGLVALRSESGPVRALRQEADGVAWQALPEGLRVDDDRADVWQDLTTEEGQARVIVFRDGVVVTAFAEDVEVGDVVDAAVELAEEQPADGDDSIGDRIRDAFEGLLDSLSLD
jgi:hypothetical protein